MAHPQTSFRHTIFHEHSILAIRRKTVAKTTLKTQLDQFRATGRYNCFELEWHPIYDENSEWPVPKHLFWDSDLAKWIEGACYFLESHYDKDIDSAVKYMVDTIRKAQQPDGYLNLHYTAVDPTGRWTNLRDMHELYNCGHLIEAALAHWNYYRNDLLLEPLLKYVELIASKFGPEPSKIHGYPGHPEIELALLRLYAETGHENSYKLARYFLEERGNPAGQDGKHFYDWEAERRQESAWKRPDHYPESGTHWYNQSHVPILEQQTIEGHSVRALYLLTAVADLLCMESGNSKHLEKSAEWLETLRRLWNNMVDKRMYVTGGVGAIAQWEGFGKDYFLPQSTEEGGCYAETCASIACVFLAERMLKLDLDGHYGDVMELCLYNNILTAMSLDGTSFTYVNQLGSSDANKSGREDWFWCACCPPNFSRFFGSLGGYLWHFGEQGGHAFVNVHLYASATLTFSTKEGLVELQQSTEWPWTGAVKFTIKKPTTIHTTMRLRIPAWACGSFCLYPTQSGSLPEAISKGYITLTPEYLDVNPSFTLEIGNFTPRWVEPHPYTNQNIAFLARGPIIYCAEDAYNPWEANHFKDVVIKPGTPVSEDRQIWQPTGEKYISLRTKAWRRDTECRHEGRGPMRPVSQIKLVDEREIIYIPYYLRANSGGNGHMRVGMVKG